MIQEEMCIASKLICHIFRSVTDRIFAASIDIALPLFLPHWAFRVYLWSLRIAVKESHKPFLVQLPRRRSGDAHLILLVVRLHSLSPPQVAML